MNVLAFFAHPDDETMLFGGALALLARLGAGVHYISATRGEGGEMGEPPLCTREELGRLRQEELECAVKSLGGRSLEFLGYEDPLVGPEDALYPFAVKLEHLAAQLQDSVSRLSIEAVITHGSNGEYGHPGHQLVHQAAVLAVTDLGERAPLLYTGYAAFEGHPKPRLVNKDDPAHLVLDVNAVLDAKINAALCHRTQNPLFVRRASQDAGRQMSVPEVIQKVESLHRVYPRVEQLPLDDALANLLRSAGAVTQG
jgi:LmbE family N-acetylglucosaminyl deacetylase